MVALKDRGNFRTAEDLGGKEVDGSQGRPAGSSNGIRRDREERSQPQFRSVAGATKNQSIRCRHSHNPVDELKRHSMDTQSPVD